MKLTLSIFIYFFSSLSIAQVRQTVVKPDEILTVKTALGIATIIQLPETIQSAIIGDQSGFKVEYLDHAVTIKPLRYGVKTNLYLVTEKRRYNVRLVTLNQAVADYIVYVKNPDSLTNRMNWVTVRKSQQKDDIRLLIERISFSESGFILIDAKVFTSSSKNTFVKPEDFEIRQGANSKVINGLFLSDLKLSKAKPIHIGVSVAKSDLISGKSITLELKKNISITLSEALIWK